MEKKGELLNQLAIISDLLEKANINSITQTIMFELDENDFQKFQHECPKCGFEWNDNGTT